MLYHAAWVLFFKTVAIALSSPPLQLYRIWAIRYADKYREDLRCRENRVFTKGWGFRLRRALNAYYEKEEIPGTFFKIAGGSQWDLRLWLKPVFRLCFFRRCYYLNQRSYASERLWLTDKDQPKFWRGLFWGGEGDRGLADWKLLCMSWHRCKAGNESWKMPQL